jgi:hypothetical protein
MKNKSAKDATGRIAMSVGSIHRIVCLTITGLLWAALASTQAADPKAPVVIKTNKDAQIPAVLSNVPTSAAAVIVAPNMEALEGKLALLQRVVGIPLPPLQSVVAQMKQMTQLENAKGVNPKGSIALVFADVTAVMGGIGGGAGGADSSIVLLPVSDYDALSPAWVVKHLTKLLPSS